MDSNYKKERHDAFKRLAEKRVIKALRAIESVSKLSDPKNYTYTDEDIKKVCSVLDNEIQKLKQSFESCNKEEPAFKL
jgi:hypothetical protein